MLQQPWESSRGKTLTLSADGPLPAFFADTREGLAVDHTGAPVMAGTGQAATVSGYKTRADKSTLSEDPKVSGGARTRQREMIISSRNQTADTFMWPCLLKIPPGTESYLCYRSFLPSLQDIYT
jgi:hypothetical protein